jgi:uncharacterized protein (TIGR04255 family)
MTSGNSTSGNPLPSYKRPPVDEVVCGFRFERLRELRVPHIGLLWEKFRSEYPTVQHAVPIASDNSLPVDELTGIPLPRVWFISKADSQLIQFQLDRLYYNWRHRGDDYPRYPAIIKNFENAKKHLETFAKESELGPIKPLECELTYINHIPIGQAWERIDDLPNVIGDFTWRKEQDRFLPHPTNIAWQVRFELPEKKGWLNVKLNQATRKLDGVPSLILELTARGSGEDKTTKGMHEWFDLAHEWIVRGFTDLTQKQIQEKIWKREK